MKRFAMALLLGAFATTALAADARYFVVTDTVGNCSVVDSKPGQSSGLKIVGDKGGYSSSDAASKVLKDMTKNARASSSRRTFLFAGSGRDCFRAQRQSLKRYGGPHDARA